MAAVWCGLGIGLVVVVMQKSERSDVPVVQRSVAQRSGRAGDDQQPTIIDPCAHDQLYSTVELCSGYIARNGFSFFFLSRSPPRLPSAAVVVQHGPGPLRG